MADTRVEEFLDLYKQLEQLLKAKYGNDRGYYESVVVRFENSRECGRYKDELAAIRDLRNLLQHNPKINGRYIAEPSEDVLKTLKAIVKQVEHPRLAADYGVKANKVYYATLGSKLLKVVNVMKDRGFAHVPVMENGKIFGVLSSYALVEFVTEQGLQVITEETRVSAMRDYLPIDSHKQEYYLFMSKDATFFDADTAFEKRDAKGRRLVTIFITEHGRADEPLIAMLTPWSVVGK